jgi:hypothetical protein
MQVETRTWMLAGLAVVLAAACAPTRERIPDEGERYSFRTAHTPYAAAICIARNARARAGSSAEERTVGASSTEVIVRAGSGQTLAVARVDNEGTFSRASILVTPQVRSDREGFARQLMQGC